MDLNLKKIYLDGLIINHNKTFNNILDEITNNNYLYNEELEELKDIKNKMNNIFKKINERIIFLILLNTDY
jgi:hypothetical protein